MMRLVPVVMNYPSLMNIVFSPTRQRDIHSMSAVLFMYAQYEVIISTICNKPVVIIDKPL